MARPVQQVARHWRLAVRASRTSVAVAFVGGTLLPLLLPVSQAWLVAVVALVAAVLAVGLVAVAGQANPPTDVDDVEAALEGTGTAGLVAHALARAALVLGALALGLALGGLLPGAREA